MVDSARSLSEDEVEALLQSAEKDTHANNRASIEHVGPVSEFRFGDDDLSLLGDFHALRIINEKFARLVRVIFSQCYTFNHGLIVPHLRSNPTEITVTRLVDS